MCAKHDVGTWRFLRFAIAAMALAGAFAVGNLAPSPSLAIEAGPLTPAAPATAPASFAGLVETVKPAVVNISVKGRVQAITDGTDPAMPFGPQTPFGPEGVPPGSPFEDFLRRFFERQGVPADPDGRTFEGMGTGFIVVGAAESVLVDGRLETRLDRLASALAIEIHARLEEL